MQPSVMGASAASSVRAIVDIAENYSFFPLAGRGKALRQRRFRDALEVSHRGSPSDRNEAPALPIRSIRSISTTLADLLTLLLVANPFSTMRASLQR
jgi:hypothetical protein